jgi:long-chain acyl-CoA synthetase
VLGGEVQLLFTGSAPISTDVIDFLKIALACEVDEGNGVFFCVMLFL